MYDPTATPNRTFSEDWYGNTIGFFKDLGEVTINYTGALLGGLWQTSIAESNQKVLTSLTNYAKETNQEITLVGHSAGGLRNYLALLNSEPDQFKNSEGKSVLNVINYGSPINNYLLEIAAQNSGANLLQHNIKDGDTVGYTLGLNGTAWDVVGGIAGSILLFSKWSPHSQYECQGFSCANSGNFNIDLNKVKIIEPDFY